MISTEYITRAANVISARLTNEDLDVLLHKHVPSQLITEGVSGIRGSKFQKSLLLVEARGSELFADSFLRKKIVAGDPGLASLLVTSGNKISVDEASIKAWHPGKESASNFVTALGLPSIFAGIPAEPNEVTLVEIKPFEEIPRLVDFQNDVVDQILRILQNSETAMVSLPTGAGKTRVAMESIIQYQDRIDEGLIVWLGTTGEICEQACQTYLTLRHVHPPVSTVQLHRFWGNHQLSFELKNGILVASVQKLRSCIEAESIPYHILKKIKAVFFDEGHHAIAPTYEKTITYLEQCGDKVALVGLTATPGRGSDPESRSSRELSRRFKMRLVTPRGEEWENPVEYLQGRRILSKPDIISVKTNRNYDMNEKVEKYWEEFKEISPDMLRNISKDAKRNSIIISSILKNAPERKGIIFGCSIEHAEYLSFLLRRIGKRAVCISSNTRSATRKQIVKELKNNLLDYLTNFGVLTTGFDDPLINLIVLARPVTSQVLFEQMVGRGLRGPEFGGTEDCIIMDFEDNINLHGRPLAYKRFRRLWN